MSYYGGRLAPFFDTGRLDRTCRRMADHGGERMTALVKANTPIGHQPFSENYIPGHLRASIEQKITVVYADRGRIVYESGCETNVDYAIFVEDGTGLWGPRRAKYEIKPKRPGGWLRFRDQKTGDVIFAKRVMHPGSPGQHMFAIGAVLTEHEANTFLESIAREWAREQESDWSHQRPVFIGRRVV